MALLVDLGGGILIINISPNPCTKYPLDNPNPNKHILKIILLTRNPAA